MKNTATNNCAVIIGRFQFFELQQAHKDLIQKVIDNNEKTLIVLGLSPIRNSLINPLEFKHRKAAINEAFPNLEVHYIEDNRDDSVWSKNLDKQISKWLPNGKIATIYGGYDNLIKVYNGKYLAVELDTNTFVSSAEIRRNILSSYSPTKDFRAGLIAATALRYPTCFTTVDIAVYDDKKNQVLMAKKPGETKYRFVGGFSDPQSDSFELDAIRELKEETGLIVNEKDIHFAGTTKIPDWRYKNEIDCIKTIFFVADYQGGTPQADDDIESVKWISLTDLKISDVVYEHEKLVDLFQQWFWKNKQITGGISAGKLNMIVGNGKTLLNG